LDSITCNSHFVKSVRLIFDESGISIAEWARAEGFSAALVYQVIEGKRKCLRGQSHRIAVALGLKGGVISDLSQLQARLAAFAAQGHQKKAEEDM
jgi:gp16 family phage-associated protein